MRVTMSDVARLAAGSLLRRMLTELMLEAHVRRTRGVTANDVGAALTAAGATTHEADGASVARLTAAVGSARGFGSSRRSNRAATRASAAST